MTEFDIIEKRDSDDVKIALMGTLGNTETLNPQPRQYVNRLSDLLFVLSRALNRHAGGNDVLWQKGRQRG